jgi:hypothetical protein
MKSKLFFLALLFSASISYSQTNETVSFKLKNRAFWFKKVVLISYTPDEAGNGTRVFWMLPKDSKAFRFEAGTKLYLANQRQVGIVMSGDRIDNEKPFLVVTRDIARKSVKL